MVDNFFGDGSNKDMWRCYEVFGVIEEVFYFWRY